MQHGAGRYSNAVAVLELAGHGSARPEVLPQPAERFILGTAGRAGFSKDPLYRLNCRSITSIPAHGSVDFQMQTTAPTSSFGSTLEVTWRLLARGLGLGLGPFCRFSVALPA